MVVQHRPPPGKYRLTVEDFLRLDETGVFGTDRTELIDGDIIVMNAEYRPHAWAAGELGYRLRRALEELGSDLHVTTASIAISPHDMPLPDLVLTREPRGAGPVPLATVALVIEVSSSTLDRDMHAKLPSYAGAGIPEYWIADLNGRVIHQLWSPAGTTYGERRELPLSGELAAMKIPDLTVDLTGL